MNPRTYRSSNQIEVSTSNFRGGITKALLALMAVFALPALGAAKDLPEAPSAVAAEASPAYFVSQSAPVVRATQPSVETRPVDLKFVSLALISTGSTFADSYTTMFATQNWLAGKKGVCNMEVESAYLYGTHPTAARSYAVASVKSVGAIAAAYYLRKHHSRIWGLPLLANSAISLQGVTQNMIACN
ncbi:MAG TPA: hypothetical protein VND65_00530 [Candidatus Binatia bacterium]|nr:hypothetical protein [Candidatus Binatia bacterium]